MSYGTENGVSNNLSDYSELIDDGSVTEEMIGEMRAGADGLIDGKLSKIIPRGSLPLASPPAAIVNISDDLTTYFVLRRVFTGKDPNDSEWVDKFYVRPLELLDKLIAESPDTFADAVGNSLASGSPASTTADQDRTFSVTRTSGGGVVSDDTEGTMDKW